MIDFKFSFTPSGRVRINGKYLSKFELGTFIHLESMKQGLGYYKYLHCAIYFEKYSYNDLVYFFKDFLKSISIL